jgi:ribosome-binding ATPase
LAALEKANTHLLAGKSARSAGLTKDEMEEIKGLMLLTMKPVIYAANVADVDLAKGNEMSQKVFEFAKAEGAKAVLVSAQVESELAGLSPEDRIEFLNELNVSEDNCGLKALVRTAYDTLGLQTYFTAGPTETRAWTIKKGFTAPQVTFS